MAYTKIHAIKATVDKAIDYICNPEKTDESIYISSYACAPETAAIDFKYTLDHCRENSPNKAYHLIQAFAPGEVSFGEAHRIGKELADKVLEGKYSYVVTTHIDKGHVHNHIIFCAADNLNYDKYHDCKQSYYRIRKLSDELCAEHNLSVIFPGEQRGKKYKEWHANQSDSSWKTKLRRDINASVRASSTYEEFLLLMRAKGYEIKGSGFGENAHKFISFRPLDRERFIRGSAKSLGAEYTKERIRERIEEKTLAKGKKRVPFPVKKKPLVRDYSKKNLIDTSEDKFAGNPGLKHWADIQNLKIAAANYNQAGSIFELEEQISAKSTLAKTARESLLEAERQLKDLGQILKYAEQYKTNHIYHIRYQKSKDKDRYLRQHETELLLHDGAENMLKRFGVDTRNLDIEKLRSDYNSLYSKKQALQKTYKTAEKETADLKRKLNNLNQYLERTPKLPTVDRKGKEQSSL